MPQVIDSAGVVFLLLNIYFLLRASAFCRLISFQAHLIKFLLSGKKKMKKNEKSRSYVVTKYFELKQSLNNVIRITFNL